MKEVQANIQVGIAISDDSNTCDESCVYHMTCSSCEGEFTACSLFLVENSITTLAKDGAGNSVRLDRCKAAEVV